MRKRSKELTDPHHNQEPGAKPAEIQHGAPAAFHEIIRVRTSAAYPVGERREDVGGDDEEGEVVAPEGGGEDDEEESDGEDLVNRYGQRGWGNEGWVMLCCGGWRRETYEGERDDCFEACCHGWEGGWPLTKDDQDF